MKFFSPTSNAISVGLTSGHMAVVTAQGTELDDMFHREAISLGCVPDSESGRAKPEAGKPFNRAAVISEALEAMMDGSDEGDFKADGTPNLRVLTAKCGFQVSREESDAIWLEVSTDK